MIPVAIPKYVKNTVTYCDEDYLEVSINALPFHFLLVDVLFLNEVRFQHRVLLHPNRFETLPFLYLVSVVISE